MTKIITVVPNISEGRDTAFIEDLQRRLQAVPGLVVPHPRMHQRAFVLRPLAGIAPAVTIPGQGLARRHLRAVRNQAASPTRSHHPH